MKMDEAFKQYVEKIYHDLLFYEMKEVYNALKNNQPIADASEKNVLSELDKLCKEQTNKIVAEIESLGITNQEEMLLKEKEIKELIKRVTISTRNKLRYQIVKK